MNDEMLKYWIKENIINIAEVRKQYEMKEHHKYLEMHQNKYKIWQGKNGKWYTYLPDDTKKSGRVQRERNTRKEVEDIAVAFWREQAENPTIKEVFEEWRTYQLANLKISKATDTYNVQLFEKHFTEFGKKRIKTIKASEVSKFICHPAN